MESKDLRAYNLQRMVHSMSAELDGFPRCTCSFCQSKYSSQLVDHIVRDEFGGDRKSYETWRDEYIESVEKLTLEINREN